MIAKGLTAEAIAHGFDTERRLLIQCVRGAHNLVREAKGEGTLAN